jgi:subtilisin family serine protease
MRDGIEEGVAYMKRVTLLLTVALAMTLACAGLALAQDAPMPTQGQGPPEGVIPSQYIVVFKDGVQDPTAVARGHAQRHGAEVLFTYQHSIKGYAARFPEGRLDKVRADEQVAYVEPDQTMYAEAQTLPWGIDKIDADVSSTKAGNGSGAVSGVNAYIIDTGIYRHTDLYRVKHVNFVGDGRNTDCHGHGTHVAGTVAAKDNTSDVVGVAPGAPLTGVKVLGCNGSGATSGVIKGVDWVTANARKPAIANMSLGGGLSQALDDAVRRSAAGGVFYSIAAGNDGADACLHSPARAGAGTDNGIATVAASTSSDGETSWSNYGPCVDVWAPGASILSTKKGGGTTTMSGTSMAAPHVGGGAALYLSKNTAASPTTVEGALTSGAMITANTSKDGATIVREYISGF